MMDLQIDIKTNFQITSKKNKTSVSFYTLGCRLNQSETAVIEQSFYQNNYRVVDFKQPADIAVINTCTVTENGDADTRRLVRKINRINPNTQIALIGCQAQIQKDQLTDLQNVRWVVGNAKKNGLDINRRRIYGSKKDLRDYTRHST